MKMLTFILILSVIIISCKKDSHSVNPQTSTNVKKYAVKFSVAEFTETVGPINASKTHTLALIKHHVTSYATPVDTTALSKQVIQYFYLVYDKDGNEIRRIERFSGTQNEYIFHSGPAYNYNHFSGVREYATTNPYNVITDSLAAGTYTVVFAGTDNENEIGINTWVTDFDGVDEFYDKLQQAVIYAGQGLYPVPRSQQLYFSKSTLVVGNANTASNITMNRVVGQLEVILQDAIPANVAFINVGRQNEDGGFMINTEVPTYPDENVDDAGQVIVDKLDVITSSEIGKTGLSFYRYIWNTVTPVTVIVEAHGKNGQVLFTKTIPNVPFYKNRRTILTGKLFNNTSSAQFTVSANQTWGPDGPTIHF